MDYKNYGLKKVLFFQVSRSCYFPVTYPNQCEQVRLCCSQQGYSARDGRQDQPHNPLKK